MSVFWTILAWTAMVAGTLYLAGWTFGVRWRGKPSHPVQMLAMMIGGLLGLAANNAPSKAAAWWIVTGRGRRLFGRRIKRTPAKAVRVALELPMAKRDAAPEPGLALLVRSEAMVRPAAAVEWRGMSVPIIIRYDEINGAVLERTIEVHEFGDRVIVGWCIESKTDRRFNLSNIRSAVDAITGEVITDLPAFLVARKVADLASRQRMTPLQTAKIPVLLRYHEAHNAVTDRLVDVQSLDEPHFAGWCHLHRGNRTFRLDHVETASDPATGVPIGSLSAYLEAKGI